MYDSGGQRVKKLVRKGAATESTVYIDGVFEHRRQNGTANNVVHLIAGGERVAVVRFGPALKGDGAANKPVQYHVADHLGSSSMVFDDAGAFISREEYSPFGETLFGGFARKRYRFCGKERDQESGCYYVGARYYSPWLARWISPDPAGPIDGTNLFRYARDNPVPL